MIFTRDQAACLSLRRLLPLFVVGLMLLGMSTGLTVAENSTSTSFSLTSSSTLVSAGLSNSTSFGLLSCIDAAPSGMNSGASFRLQSGCSVLSTTTQGSVKPPGPRPKGSVPVPIDQPFLLLGLILGALLVAIIAIRQTPTPNG